MHPLRVGLRKMLSGICYDVYSWSVTLSSPWHYVNYPWTIWLIQVCTRSISPNNRSLHIEVISRRNNPSSVYSTNFNMRFMSIETVSPKSQHYSLSGTQNLDAKGTSWRVQRSTWMETWQTCNGIHTVVTYTPIQCNYKPHTDVSTWAAVTSTLPSSVARLPVKVFMAASETVKPALDTSTTRTATDLSPYVTL